MSKLRDSRRREAQGSTTGQERDRTTVPSSGGMPQRVAVPAQGPVSLSTVAELSNSARERIAERAYQLWEAKGRPAGTDLADWFEAERLLCTPA
jgi:Protein of unknown function (DUF2934)